jgi:hypothetical protein
MIDAGSGTHQSQDREAQNSEHQATHHFVRRARPHGSPAVVIPQSTIDPFGRAAVTVTNLFRHAAVNRVRQHSVIVT